MNLCNQISKKCFHKRNPRRFTSHFKRVWLDFAAVCIEFYGEGEHVDLLVNFLPKIAVFMLVNKLKGISSRILKKQSSFISQKIVE
ncbi:transposase [Bartonella gliris]|uniref:transposase n=1 Tax=Bartonella gliris TaxID=3004109 RepID=UPI0037C02585